MHDRPVGRNRPDLNLPGPCPCGEAGCTLVLRALVVVGIAVSVLGSCAGGAKPAAKPGANPPTVAPTTTSPRATKPLAPRPAAYVYRITVGGRVRDYRLHVPPAARTGRALPLVLNLHGATQNATLQELQSGMDASSDRDGYLVAYPDGTRIAKQLTRDPVAGDAQYGFNAGACCGDPSTNHVDDVDFLLAVISDAAARTPVDLRRVYVTGMSNGGMMAYAMAAQASTHIAAIASVAGQLELATIHPTRAVPTLEFHSVDDPIARFDGSDERATARPLLGDGRRRRVGSRRRLRPDPARRDTDRRHRFVGRARRDARDVLGMPERHRGRAVEAAGFRTRVARRGVQHRAA